MSPEQKEERARSKMVGWYDPRQLAFTGRETVLSALFAQRADYRQIEALREPSPDPHPYVDEKEIWIDYVADVGDGFNSTYAIARLLGSASLGDENGQALPRGKILVMGGDEVYPTPSREAYQARLVRPYAAALRPEDAGAGPDLYAIPGNHDWYDGLGSFMNLFCHGSSIGSWDTPQHRSYFALQLAHDYWLLGVDIQLGSDIDDPQSKYFMGLPIKPGDRIILCTAEPDWIYGNIRKDRTTLGVLETKLEEEKKAEIVLQLAGDLHHYRRHTRIEDDGAAGHVHLVTAGGGGAFLHPTHTYDVDTLALGPEGSVVNYAVEAKTVYPSRVLSRWLGAWNVFFVFRNPWFGIATGGLYTMLSWVMPVDRLVPEAVERGLPWLLAHGVEAAAGTPSSLAWVALVLLGFVGFTDTHKRVYKWLAGLFHGALHLAAALGISATTTYLLAREEMNVVLLRFVGALMTFVGGYFVGATIMGLYLAVSVCVFRRHGNEAFSALKIEGYKNFLRMRLDKNGLSVWAFGLDEVPGDKEWAWAEDEHGRGRYEPTSGAPKLEPRVIDHFVIPARKPASPPKKKDVRRTAPVEEIA